MDPDNSETSSRDKNPQINSIISEERIHARRLRIQRRIEAARRLLSEDSEENTVCEEEKSLLEKQVEASAVAVSVLLEEGRELVTNVQVAGESHEVKRRVSERSAKEKRLQKLEEEASLALVKFEDINSKWEEIATYNDPLDLHQQTESQKEKCMELIKQKDLLISELKSELEEADKRFVKDQIKQSEDISLLVQRIDSLVKIMKRTYRNELSLIEQAINNERKDIVETNNKRWQALYKERERAEASNLEHRFLTMNEHNDTMNQIMVEHQEKFRSTKISLENDIQVLQQQLEQMKAVCLLNREKMEYNYQVLKKREEESLLIRSQQKRRINKLQDSVTTLRHRIQMVEQATIADEKRLRSEVVKLHGSIKDIQLKAKHFALVNNNKYNQLWNFNDESAKKLLNKILNIDRIVYEQHLGISWEIPKLTYLKKTDMESYQAALDSIQSNKKTTYYHENHDGKKTSIISNRLMRHILKAIANSAGFLVESKLLTLLKDYTEEEENLVCLDNVFSALDLKYKEDIEVLRKQLEPYIKCNNCETAEEDSFICDEGQRLTKEKGVTEDEKKGGSENGEEERIPSKSLQGKVIKKKVTCINPEHIHYIEPSRVLQTLKDFVKNFTLQKGRDICTLSIKDEESPETVSRLLKNNDVKLYWERFCQIFSPEKEKLWDCLMIGLTRYHSILQERHKINNEVEQLKLQNSELRCLLKRYALPNNMKAGCLKPTHELLPPLVTKSSQETYTTPINLFLQITENKKINF